MEPKGTRLQSTGVSGLDRLLNGGYPRGALVLLAGNPGTGKSTLAAKFIYEGAVQAGEPGIYVNFVEPKRDFLDHMRMLGMDFEQLEEKGLFHYIEAVTIVDEDALIKQLEEILKLVAETGAKRLVVDSVTAMLQIIQDKAKIRELVQNFFVNGVKQMGTTTILIAEHPYGAKMVGYGIEEFIVDAVMILRFEIVHGKVRRILELRKARWAPIRQAEVPFYIRPGTVVEVSLPEAPEEVPPLDLSQRFNLAEAFRRLEKSSTGTWLFRCSPLTSADETERGHIFSIPRGAQVVLGHYPTLDSKYAVAAIAAALLLHHEPRILVVSVRSSPTALTGLVKCLLGMVTGSPARAEELARRLHVVSYNPTAFTVLEINDNIRQLIDAVNPDIFVFEGLDVIEQFADRNEYLEILYNTMLRNKKRRVTSIYTISAIARDRLYERLASTLADIAAYIGEPQYTVEEGPGQSYLVDFAGLFGRTQVRIHINTRFLYARGCVG